MGSDSVKLEQLQLEVMQLSKLKAEIEIHHLRQKWRHPIVFAAIPAVILAFGPLGLWHVTAQREIEEQRSKVVRSELDCASRDLQKATEDNKRLREEADRYRSISAQLEKQIDDLRKTAVVIESDLADLRNKKLTLGTHIEALEEKRRQLEKSDQPAPPPVPMSSLRWSPIVNIVAKAKPSVVTVRVPRIGERAMVGSGVIVDGRGLIVTNRHVVGSNKSVLITLDDAAEITGEVIASDDSMDLALIRVNPGRKLQALQPISAADLLLGEQVIAIGSPFGYEATVSTGIISGLNREIRMPTDVVMKDLIQTTAPFNPGCSGSPLINIEGNLIGIGVAMRDGGQSVAFAINGDMVIAFLRKNTPTDLPK